MTTHQEIIAGSRARALELISQNPEGLTGAALDEFTAAMNRAESHQEEAQRAATNAQGLAKWAGVLGEATHTRTRATLPTWRFDDESLHEAHAAHREGRSTQIRAVSAAPMATEGFTGFGPGPYVREPFRVASLFEAVSIDTPNATVYRQTTAASAAGMVGVGQEKPESTPAWSAIPVPVRKVAHFVDVPTEFLSDYADFERVVTSELIAGVIHKENQQIMSGDGLSENLLGLLEQPSTLTYTATSGEAEHVSLVEAIAHLRTAGLAEATGVVLHPQDWKSIQIAASEEIALVATFDQVGSPRLNLWGLPVHITTGIPQGAAVVADFARSGIVFSREQPRVIVDPFSQSKYNLVRFIAEERLAFGSPRPQSACIVEFDLGS